MFCSHGEPWSRFRSRVSKALAAPEAARAAVPDLDRVTDDFIDRYVVIKLDFTYYNHYHSLINVTFVLKHNTMSSRTKNNHK